jgi:predicted RNA-binding Zn-ribbon protein involved in translation (DUF1610 family)
MASPASSPSKSSESKSLSELDSLPELLRVGEASPPMANQLPHRPHCSRSSSPSVSEREIAWSCPQCGQAMLPSWSTTQDLRYKNNATANISGICPQRSAEIAPARGGARGSRPQVAVVGPAASMHWACFASLPRENSGRLDPRRSVFFLLFPTTFRLGGLLLARRNLAPRWIAPRWINGRSLPVDRWFATQL